MISSTSPNDTQEIYPYAVKAEQMPSYVVEDRDLRSHRFWKDNKFYQTSVRSASNNSYFFPTTGMYNITCGLVNMSYKCTFGSNFSVDTGVWSTQTPIDRFKTILFLHNNNGSSVIQGNDYSSWTVTEIGTGSAATNATCSDVYTQVSPKCLYGSFSSCYRSVLQFFFWNWKVKLGRFWILNAIDWGWYLQHYSGFVCGTEQNWKDAQNRLWPDRDSN